ncbi:LLM class flavin-dependent oxidoreductase [Acidovorax sp. SUPP2522]|uniref:LLM class flavin-dependent oxidoreductase n=1 Tax=unclassified Acidovorax TaxID=2684926 RepID=UPI00234955A7|nr:MULTISPECIES: LLM class flavin-dependent oxidoreductase [unclassified Acidovorax]WCM97072.1 LLM class flavin-dependent oxidoreductase [Acidovorax sp. GBBC 1281]GKT15681.1 LLM class flavin-dependent oxidoreductase [Acidovorax sp. SUPP2522]
MHDSLLTPERSSEKIPTLYRPLKTTIKPWIFEQLNTSADPAASAHCRDAFQEEFAWRLKLWTEAEHLGFHGIFFSEHHFSGARISPAPGILAAALAARTRTLRIGILGWVLPLWHPWRFLEEVGMLDHLSGGRLEVGVARGSNPLEAHAVGIAQEDIAPMFDEALEILDKAWSHPTLSHQGKYWSFDQLPVLPRPLQRPGPPVWATIRSNASAQEVAKRGYKACTGFLATPQIKELFDNYRSAWTANGHPCNPEQLAVRRCIFVAQSASEAREHAQAAQTQIPSILTDDIIAGTPVEVIEQIVEQARLTGAANIVGFFAGNRENRASFENSYRLFGTKVIPTLQRTPMN